MSMSWKRWTLLILCEGALVAMVVYGLLRAKPGC
jgi:hypothetical protein